MGLFYIIGFLVIFFIAAFLTQQWLLKRSLIEVVTIFQEKGATTPETARTLEELDLQPPGFLKRPAAFRNYKHRIVETLLTTGIVIVTEDQKYYLSESELTKSPIHQMVDTADSG